MGRLTWFHVRPRFTEMFTPPSFTTAMRSPSVGSIHISWLSHPGFAGILVSVRPPSSDREKDFIFVVGSNLLARVVMCAPAQLPVGIDHLPGIAAVVRAPELPELACGVHFRMRDPVACLNFRVHAAGIFFCYAHGNPTDRRMRQAMTFQALPGRPTIG